MNHIIKTESNSTAFAAIRFQILTSILLLVMLSHSIETSGQSNYGLYLGTGINIIDTKDDEQGSTLSITLQNKLGAYRLIRNNWQLEIGVNYAINNFNNEGRFSRIKSTQRFLGGHIGARKIFNFNRLFISSLNQLTFLNGQYESRTSSVNSGFVTYEFSSLTNELSLNWVISPGVNLTSSGKHRLMLDVPLGQIAYTRVNETKNGINNTSSNIRLLKLPYEVLAFTYLMRF